MLPPLRDVDTRPNHPIQFVRGGIDLRTDRPFHPARIPRSRQDTALIGHNALGLANGLELDLFAIALPGGNKLLPIVLANHHMGVVVERSHHRPIDRQDPILAIQGHTPTRQGFENTEIKSLGLIGRWVQGGGLGADERPFHPPRTGLASPPPPTPPTTPPQGDRRPQQTPPPQHYPPRILRQRRIRRPGRQIGETVKPIGRGGQISARRSLRCGDRA